MMYNLSMKKILILLILFVFIAPVTHAQRQTATGSTRQIATESTRQTATTNSSGEVIKLKNPLGGGEVDSIPLLVEKLLEIVLQIGVPLVAIMIIYSGYLFVAARGNPGELTKAKETLKYTFIGAAILLGAYVIAEALVGTICAIKGGCN